MYYIDFLNERREMHSNLLKESICKLHMNDRPTAKNCVSVMVLQPQQPYGVSVPHSTERKEQVNFQIRTKSCFHSLQYRKKSLCHCSTLQTQKLSCRSVHFIPTSNIWQERNVVGFLVIIGLERKL
ncbi:Hypothetical_protein [Hexamita inflata]|uniref:Hypothetical_protein n=1 Tax=Hexamita inflata TaxID=28002 RepID=A0AA86RHZ0_9EUKA|nr:Hypothetical protein HINF_LOCUS65976 [Hexamita inflata]